MNPEASVYKVTFEVFTMSNVIHEVMIIFTTSNM